MESTTIYRFIKASIIVFLIVGFALLFATAIEVHDTAVIRTHPWLFVAELILMSVLPAIPLLFFVVSRKISIKIALFWFYALSAKFAILHILFQLSGFYSDLFGMKTPRAFDPKLNL